MRAVRKQIAGEMPDGKIGLIITLLFALLIHGSLSEVERNVMDSRLKADLVCLMDDLSITDA